MGKLQVLLQVLAICPMQARLQLPCHSYYTVFLKKQLAIYKFFAKAGKFFFYLPRLNKQPLQAVVAKVQPHINQQDNNQQ
jgi:hypothetical protein